MIEGAIRDSGGQLFAAEQPDDQVARFAQLRFNAPETHLLAGTPVTIPIVTMPIATSPEQNASEVEIEQAIRSGIERYFGD